MQQHPQQNDAFPPVQGDVLLADGQMNQSMFGAVGARLLVSGDESVSFMHVVCTYAMQRSGDENVSFMHVVCTYAMQRYWNLQNDETFMNGIQRFLLNS